MYSIFPELEDLKDYDLDEKVVDEIKTKLGSGLEKFHRDLGVSSSDASNYKAREFGDDDEYNPYWCVELGISRVTDVINFSIFSDN